MIGMGGIYSDSNLAWHSCLHKIPTAIFFLVYVRIAFGTKIKTECCDQDFSWEGDTFSSKNEALVCDVCWQGIRILFGEKPLFLFKNILKWVNNKA